jgi:uncharacterized membrane protein
MAEQGPLDERLDRLESKLDRIERLLIARAEPTQHAEAATAPIAPPPVIAPRPQPQFSAPSPQPSPAQPTPKPAVPLAAPAPSQGQMEPPKPNFGHGSVQDAEYEFASKWIPRIGGVLVVIGMIFAVWWGYKNNIINEGMIFGMEVLGSISLVVFGYRSKKLTEQFNEILVGVGMGGLYAAFVGGGQLYHFYGGEVVVSLAVGCSLAMLVMAYIRRWVGVGVLGVLGGLSSSLMPWQQHEIGIGLAIHFAVVAAAAALCGYRKRSGFLVALWFSALLCFVDAPGLSLNPPPWILWSIVFDGAILYAASVWASDDALEAFLLSSGILVVHGLICVASSSLERLLVTVALAALASLIKVKSPTFPRFFGVALLVLVFGWPLCVPEPNNFFVFIGESLTISAASFFFWRRPLLAVSALLYLASFAAIPSIRDAGSIGSLTQMSLLLAGGILGCLATVSYEKPGHEMAVGYFYLLPIWWTWSDAFLKLFGGNPFATSFSWSILAAISLLIGALARLRVLRLLALTLLILTVGRVMLVDLADLEIGYRALALLILGGVMMLVGYGYIRWKRAKLPEQNP